MAGIKLSGPLLEKLIELDGRASPFSDLVIEHNQFDAITLPLVARQLLGHTLSRDPLNCYFAPVRKIMLTDIPSVYNQAIREAFPNLRIESDSGRNHIIGFVKQELCVCKHPLVAYGQKGELTILAAYHSTFWESLNCELLANHFPQFYKQD